MKSFLIILSAVYPVFYAISSLLALFFRKRINLIAAPDYLPSLSLIISSSGEDEGVIRTKLQNTLALDYPKRIEIILFSDGGRLPGALLLDFPTVRMIDFDRLGKTECQNRCIEMAQNEIIVSTDVTALLEKDTLRKCTRWYADSRVGAVGGRFVYEFKNGSPENLYIERELNKKVLQAKYGYVMGYLGPFYSFRRQLYDRLPAFYQSDYIVPLMVASKGFITTIDPDILSSRYLDRAVGQEYARKRRIVAQGISTTFHFLCRNRLLVLQRPDLFFAIVAIKLLRWFLLPYLLMLYLIGWTQAPIYLSFITITGAAAVLVSRMADRSGLQNKYIKAPYYAFLLCGANMAALFDFISGNRYTTWDHGSR